MILDRFLSYVRKIASILLVSILSVETDTGKSDKSLSNVSAFDDDLDKIKFQTTRMEEEILDDE